MVHNKPITIYNIEDNIDIPVGDGRRPRASGYRVAPSENVEERCELIKSTYGVISKYTRAMFDRNETVV
ncbi:unnamed protein product [Leptidea sinapis]|uniref:Uncharacterized protein n=1 Tax=Leptidea sinapis TaxID=189913 RepID=A0A5E4PS77_9NEOP|nr:unnamed protein product [Leptidea sinapis]